MAVREYFIEGQKDHWEPHPPQLTGFISPFVELTSPGLTVVVWVRHVHEYYSIQHSGITYVMEQVCRLFQEGRRAH